MKHECKFCNYATKYLSHYRTHVASKKHKQIEEMNNRHEQLAPISSKADLIAPISPKADWLAPISPKAVLAPEAQELAPEAQELAPELKNDSKSIIIDEYNNESGANTIKSEANQELVCSVCKTQFQHKSSLSRHKKNCKLTGVITITNNNLLDTFICPLCKITSSRKSSLLKHMNLCSIKYKENIEVETLKNELKTIKDENKTIKDENKHIKEINTLLSQEMNHNKQMAIAGACNMNGLIQGNNGLIETNMRAMTFLNKFVQDAPPLQNFNVEFKDPYIFYIDYDKHKKIKEEDTKKTENNKNNILYFDEDKMTKDDYVVDNIIFLQKTKQTVKYIVDRLLYFYKREEPVKQSIWNIDIYRYNFTYSLKSGDKVIWQSDKQGQITTEKILNPLLEFTCGIIENNKQNMKLELDRLVKEKKTNQMSEHVKNMECLADFMMSVKNNSLQQEIIRKLSPLLFFDVQKYDINKYKEILPAEVKALEVKT
jgi:hypothetical protein